MAYNTGGRIMSGREARAGDGARPEDKRVVSGMDAKSGIKLGVMRYVLHISHDAQFLALARLLGAQDRLAVAGGCHMSISLAHSAAWLLQIRLSTSVMTASIPPAGTCSVSRQERSISSRSPSLKRRSLSTSFGVR